MTIYLIGFMGSGKSTVGIVLGERTERSYADTDTIIETQYGSISEIFRNQGEGVFRNHESQVLKNVSTEKEIVSTGGGIVEKEENISCMKANGVIVHLQTSFAEIHNRLMGDSDRPLWNTDIKKKEKLFQRRNRMYQACADITISTDHKSPVEIASEIEVLLDQYNKE
ncbi:shikimate kinase [Virgibacillus ihumii]|uniref:shikimate kinase n=1 Tax=Virgibacillus ihumii TaxID=2686091 RepID=UPI00157CE4B3|nr:shikimate kinase [Virgibacillus ihumii]